MTSQLQKAYAAVQEVAAPSASEGLKKSRAILLLWFLRHVYGIDDLDAYEFVCDGDNDQGIDGLYLEGAEPDESTETLHVLQSKYPDSPKNVGVTEIRQLIGTLEPLGDAEALEGLLIQGVELELEQLIKRFDLVAKLKAGHLTIKGVLVTAGKLTPEARTLIGTTNRSRGYPFLTAYDVLDLAPMIEAFRSPTTVKGTVFQLEIARSLPYVNFLERDLASNFKLLSQQIRNYETNQPPSITFNQGDSTVARDRLRRWLIVVLARGGFSPIALFEKGEFIDPAGASTAVVLIGKTCGDAIWFETHEYFWFLRFAGVSTLGLYGKIANMVGDITPSGTLSILLYVVNSLIVSGAGYVFALYLGRLWKGKGS